jgi:hypothetical protein
MMKRMIGMYKYLRQKEKIHRRVGSRIHLFVTWDDPGSDLK